MARGKTIASPDGDPWRVRRRWSDRPMPNIWRRLRRSAEEADESAPLGFDGVLDSGLSEGWAGVAFAIAGVVLFVLLIPVLGVALELILLVVVLWSGILGRVLLGRPWVVEARDLDDGERSVAYAVKGFRRAGAAVAELEGMIAAGGPPERLTQGERTELPRPSREPG